MTRKSIARSFCTLAVVISFAAARRVEGQAFDCVLLNDDNSNIFVTPDECFTIPENQIWCNCVRSVFSNPVKGLLSGFNQAVEWIVDQPGIGNHRAHVSGGTLDVSGVQVGDVIGSTLINELIPQSVGVPPGTFFKVRTVARVTAVNGSSFDYDLNVVEVSPAAEAVLDYTPQGPRDPCHSSGLLYQGVITSLGAGSGFTLEYRYPKEKILPADGTCTDGYHAAVEENDAGGPGFTVRFLFQFFNTPAGMIFTLPTANTVAVDTTLRRFTENSLEEILPLGEPDLCQVRVVAPEEPAADPTPCKEFSEVLQLKNTAGENSPPTAKIVMIDPDNATQIFDPADRQIACGSTRIFFRGSNSDDGDGGTQPLSYEWSIVSGPEGGAAIPEETRTFNDTEITFTLPGSYEIMLAVNDGGAASNTDEASVTVNVLEDTIGNIAPTADVRTVPDPAEVELVGGMVSATLDGSTSSNGAPGIDDCMQTLSFQWTQVEGPAGKTATIVSPADPVTEVKFTFPGQYTFELEVDDGAQLDNTAIAEAIVDVTGEPAMTAFRRADSDGNAIVQITDAVRVLNVLFLGIGVILCEDSADADDNGIIQITDAVRILNVLFLGIGVIPAPGPVDCGEDPSADAFAECVYPQC